MAMDYKERIDLELERVRSGLTLPSVDSLPDLQKASVVSNYGAAIEPNFVQWMYDTYLSVESYRAKKVLDENLHTEIADDHRRMLRNFVRDCGVDTHLVLSLQDVSVPVLKMWALFVVGSGLSNLSVITALENASLTFIPYLAEIGEKLGCKDFTYTNVHGAADIGHATSLRDGLVEELKFVGSQRDDYALPEVIASFGVTTSFLNSILIPKP